MEPTSKTFLAGKPRTLTAIRSTSVWAMALSAQRPVHACPMDFRWFITSTPIPFSGYMCPRCPQVGTSKYPRRGVSAARGLTQPPVQRADISWTYKLVRSQHRMRCRYSAPAAPDWCLGPSTPRSTTLPVAWSTSRAIMGQSLFQYCRRGRHSAMVGLLEQPIMPHRPIRVHRLTIRITILIPPV